jgi:hypothetical protein
VFTTRYVLPTQCIYVFCVDLRRNSDYFTIRKNEKVGGGGGVVIGTSYISASGGEKDSITLFECSQASPARPSGKCIIK